MADETAAEHEDRLDDPEHDRSYVLFGRVILIGANVMPIIVILGIVLAGDRGMTYLRIAAPAAQLSAAYIVEKSWGELSAT